MNVQGSVALVTGANRGLGLAFARGLLAAGAHKVYAAARDPSSIAALPGLAPIRLDVTNQAHIDAAATELRDVSLLVNNAGISSFGALLGPDGVESLQRQFATNALGPLALIRAFAPVLASNGGGAVVNVLSVLSWLTLPGSGGYSASKAAGWALGNALRGELKPQGTQLLALHVAFMDTDMARHAPGPKAAPEDVVRQALAALEAGQPELLADAVTRQVKQGLAAEPAVYLGG
jgi:NAD(P)-dependent dehydrogenase (short-subunit alcohol dehydrogenase family)